MGTTPSIVATPTPGPSSTSTVESAATSSTSATASTGSGPGWPEPRATSAAATARKPPAATAATTASRRPMPSRRRARFCRTAAANDPGALPTGTSNDEVIDVGSTGGALRNPSLGSWQPRHEVTTVSSWIPTKRAAKMPSAPRTSRRPKRALLFAAAATVAFMAAPAANAGVLSGLLANPVGTLTGTVAATGETLGLGGVTSGDCANDGLEQRFAPWSDASWYYPVAASSAWKTSGGATVAGDGYVLRSGAVATSPAACVGLTSSTVRIIGKSADGASVRVDVVTKSGLAFTAGTVKLGRTSSPSPVLLNLASATALLSNGFSADVNVRLTAVGGTAQVDELWVDPFKRT